MLFSAPVLGAAAADRYTFWPRADYSDSFEPSVRVISARNSFLRLANLARVKRQCSSARVSLCHFSRPYGVLSLASKMQHHATDEVACSRGARGKKLRPEVSRASLLRSFVYFSFRLLMLYQLCRIVPRPRAAGQRCTFKSDDDALLNRKADCYIQLRARP